MVVPNGMLLVGIAGGSGSGKTTFARKIIQSVSNAGVAILHQDNYYLPSPPAELLLEERANYDHPAAFDWPLILNHLELLKRGMPIDVPVYDFKSSRRTRSTQSLGPCQAVLMEGIFALWEPQVRNLMDIKVFLNVDADIRFIRRLHRDIKERGRNIDGIIRQYYDTVRPMHHEYIETTRQFADVAVGEETDVAAQVIAARIKEAVNQSV